MENCAEGTFWKANTENETKMGWQHKDGQGTRP